MSSRPLLESRTFAHADVQHETDRQPGTTNVSFRWLGPDEFERLTPAQKDQYLGDLALHLRGADPQLERKIGDSDTEQGEIDCQLLISRSRFNRSLARELREAARVNRWMAEEACAYASYLIEQSRKLLDRRSRSSR